MDSTAKYFSGLSRGKDLISVETLETHLEKTFTYYPTANIMFQFLSAATAASRLPVMNRDASEEITRDANRFLYRELQKLDMVMEDPKLSLLDLERMMQSYARLQTVPPADVSAKILNKFQAKIGEAKADNFLNILENVTDLGIYPGDEWVEAWWKAANPQSGNWDVKQHGASVVYRLALMDFLRNADHRIDKKVESPCKRIANGFLKVFEKYAWVYFNIEMDRKVFLAAKWFDFDFIQKFSIQSEKETPLRAEGLFMQSFAGTGIAVKSKNILVPQINHKIDFELVNGHSYGAELDDSAHLNRVTLLYSFDKALAFNTETRFQSALIEKICPDLHVLRVPYFYCKPSDHHHPWEETLEHLADSDPGVYAYHGDTVITSMADENGCLFRGQPL